MSFFNSKEEVIDIELTQYGKLLLSRGLLRPAYYSFHDDDVLYDSDYANVSENTNFAEVRIQEQTPVHKPFYSFKETKPFLSSDLNQEKFIEQKANLSIEKTNLSPFTLSNSTISNLYVPSWEIYNLSSPFLSSSTTFTNKNIISASIPQFDVEINTVFYKTNQEQIDDDPRLQEIYVFEKTVLDNDSVYITINTPLLLKIIENNVDVENDAFDVQLYKVTKDDEQNEKYTQLKFYKQLQNYDDVNDLYVETVNAMQDLEVIDSNYADYYFEILSDKEISQLNTCKFVLKSIEDQDMIFEDITICEDLRSKFTTDGLYDTTKLPGLSDNATGKNC
jgi:hypothetical protein